jgi:hypothetical protein
MGRDERESVRRGGVRQSGAVFGAVFEAPALVTVLDDVEPLPSRPNQETPVATLNNVTRPHSSR